MAGTNLMPSQKGLPEPKKWEGDYWANVPKINEWFKKNKGYLNAYDDGRLEKALKSMGEKKEGSEVKGVQELKKAVNAVKAVNAMKQVKKK